MKISIDQKPLSRWLLVIAFDLNSAYLSRCFRRVTGQTVGVALLEARTETAKRLLREGHSVKATAHQAGFGSASYFCRQFIRVTGTTPRAAVTRD